MPPLISEETDQNSTDQLVNTRTVRVAYVDSAHSGGTPDRGRLAGTYVCSSVLSCEMGGRETGIGDLLLLSPAVTRPIYRLA